MSINTRNKISAALGFARTFAAALAACAVISSCEIFHADNPSQIGSITMRLPSAEQMSAASGGAISGAVTSYGILGDSSVASFKVRAKNAVTGLETSQITQPGSIIKISPLEPGFWNVTVFGNNSDGQTIYYGNSANILVAAGRTTPASVVINPVNPSTPLMATLAETPAGVSLQGQGRENVMGVYVSYSSGGQSGSAYYDFSNAAGSAKQGDDLNKITVPIPTFLEPGSAVSGKVYLFDRGGTALWGGSIDGSVKKDGTFDCAFAFLETALKGYQGSPARTFLKVEEALPAQLETPLAYTFETMAYGAPAAESKSYSDLTIFSAAPNEACGKIPVIVECGSSAWAEVFDAKHKYAEPTVTMPEQKIPLGATRTLSAVVSSSEQKEYSVFKAAQDYDARGFKLYSIQDKDTGSTVSSSSFAAPANPVSSEFTEPDKVKATGSGSDEYTWQVTVTNSAYSYFDGGESQASKTFNGTFNVSASAWTITPASVTVERGAAFALTLSCADATPADAASVTKVTLNATSAKDFVPAVSGTSLVVNAESFATWTGAKNVSVLVESVAAGTIEVTATAPSGDGGGTGGNRWGDWVQKPFSVSATKQVYFSPGNLWYQASVNGEASGQSTFKFAEKQYDIVGKAGNEAVSATNTGWIDLFPWGTSGYKTAYQPYTRGSDYIESGMYVLSMTGDDAELDWGVHNAISNGGDEPGLWRTLTSDEWYYLLNSRSGGPSKRSPARVNGIAGIVLLPDDWTAPPAGLTFNITYSGTVPSGNDIYVYETNTYSAAEWSQMEAQGAVFLPSTGTCYEDGSWEYENGSSTVTNKYIGIRYWTASARIKNGDTKFCLYTTNGGYNRGEITTTANPSGKCPAAVRLVQDTSYTAIAPVSPNKIYVAETGSDTDGDGTEAHPYATIAQACKQIVKQSEAQDYTIYIDGDLKTGRDTVNNVTIPGQKISGVTLPYAKSITLKGKNGIDASTGKPKDSLTGSYSSYYNGKMLTIETVVPVTINDLKITGGFETGGGGICIGSGTIYADVTLGSGTLVTGNKATGSGAGISVGSYSKLTVDGAEISNNYIDGGAQGVAINFNGKELTIKGNSKITGNYCAYTSQGYSAIYCGYNSSNNYTSSIVIEENAEISGNQVTGLRVYSGNVAIRGNAKISSNKNQSTSSNIYQSSGGGLYITGSTSSSSACVVTISGNVEISGNTAKNAAGVFVDRAYATLNIEGGSISGNIATTNGGGIYVYGGKVNMSGGSIVNNQAKESSSASEGGGGVFIESLDDYDAAGTFNLTGGTIKDNTCKTSGKGSGIYVTDTMNNYWTHKPSTFSMGAAAKVDASNDVYIRRTASKPTIVIASDLTQTGSLATITLESYAAGDPVLSGTLVKNYYTQFTLSDATYSIDESGALVSN